MDIIKQSCIFGVLAVSACSSPESNEKTREVVPVKEEVQVVETVVAQTKDFAKEIISNGRAVAERYAEVYWEVDGLISEVNVRNGQRVSQGERLASVGAYRLEKSLDAARASMENSRISMHDVLIGQGYSPDSSKIPQEVLDLAEIKSGYRQAVASCQQAEYDFRHTVLEAPIGGVVANLEERASNRADRSKPFCRIIDTQSLSVEFSVIESEIASVCKSEEVRVSPFSNPEMVLKGHISEVNPYVEKNGMIRVRAMIEGNPSIYEGMSLSVRIQRQDARFVAVPKSAVVMRSGRPVVFTVRNGRAEWHYVETGAENSSEVAIVNGVVEGDSVIVSGNMSLAHESLIRIVNH